MNAKTLVHESVAIIIGAAAGLFFGSATQDMWFAGIVGFVISISVFGLISFFDVLFPRRASSRTNWHVIFAVLLVVIIGTPQASSVIQTSSLYGTILLLMGALISGATIGIGIAQSFATDDSPFDS